MYMCVCVCVYKYMCMYVCMYLYLQTNLLLCKKNYLKLKTQLLNVITASPLTV